MRQRARYQDAICCSKRRLLDLIRWACPALESVLPDLRTRLSLALLGHFLDPKAVLGAHRSTLAHFIGTNASGNHPHSGPFVDQLIDRLRAAARETLALHGDAIDFAELQFEVRHEVDQCSRLLNAIAELDKRIEARPPGLARRADNGEEPKACHAAQGLLHGPHDPNSTASRGLVIGSRAGPPPDRNRRFCRCSSPRSIYTSTHKNRTPYLLSIAAYITFNSC